MHILIVTGWLHLLFRCTSAAGQGVDIITLRGAQSVYGRDLNVRQTRPRSPVRLDRRDLYSTTTGYGGPEVISHGRKTPEQLAAISEGDEGSPRIAAGSVPPSSHRPPIRSDTGLEPRWPERRRPKADSFSSSDSFSPRRRKTSWRSDSSRSWSSSDSSRSSRSSSSSYYDHNRSRSSRYSDSFHDHEDEHRFYPMSQKTKNSMHMAAQSTLLGLGVAGFGAAVGLGIAQYEKKKRCMLKNPNHPEKCQKKQSGHQGGVQINPVNQPNAPTPISPVVHRRSLDEGDFGMERERRALQTRDEEGIDKPDFSKLQKRSPQGGPGGDPSNEAKEPETAPTHNRNDGAADRNERTRETTRTMREDSARNRNWREDSARNRNWRARPGHEHTDSSSSGDFHTAVGGSQANPSQGNAPNSHGAAVHEHDSGSPGLGIGGDANHRQVSDRPSTAYEGHWPEREPTRRQSSLSTIDSESNRGHSRSSDPSSYTSSSRSTPGFFTTTTDSYYDSTTESSSSRSHRSGSDGGSPRAIQRSASEMARIRRQRLRVGLIAGSVSGAVATGAIIGSIKGVRRRRCKYEPNWCTKKDLAKHHPGNVKPASPAPIGGSQLYQTQKTAQPPQQLQRPNGTQPSQPASIPGAPIHRRGLLGLWSGLQHASRQVEIG